MQKKTSKIYTSIFKKFKKNVILELKMPAINEKSPKINESWHVTYRSIAIFE